MNASETRRRMKTSTKLLFGLLSIVIIIVAAAASVLLRQAAQNRHAGMLLEVETIERHLLECRRQEKNILLRGNGDSRRLLSANMDSLMTASMDLREVAVDAQLLEELLQLELSESAYVTDLRELTGIVDPGQVDQTMVDRMTESARQCHAAASAIRERLISLLQANHTLTRNWNLASVVLALLLLVGMTAWLTREIVRPLEYLREAAERAVRGDIQDIDIEFSSLDESRFRTEESLDLAASFGRMVTSLRHAVSSEVGLMDIYHMTILVLVNPGHQSQDRPGP